jgi:hypothetical protein
MPKDFSQGELLAGRVWGETIKYISGEQRKVLELLVII